jgi:hypothetical protein
MVKVSLLSTVMSGCDFARVGSVRVCSVRVCSGAWVGEALVVTAGTPAGVGPAVTSTAPPPSRLQPAARKTMVVTTRARLMPLTLGIRRLTSITGSSKSRLNQVCQVAGLFERKAVSADPQLRRFPFDLDDLDIDRAGIEWRDAAEKNAALTAVVELNGRRRPDDHRCVPTIRR